MGSSAIRPIRPIMRIAALRLYHPRSAQYERVRKSKFPSVLRRHHETRITPITTDGIP